MSAASPASPVRTFTPRHTSWPYEPEDFKRMDESRDGGFYSSPRYVTHIDDRAIASLREYYDTVLPHRGRILDFCSSWISHYPGPVEDAASSGQLKIIGMGMNKAELDANELLNSGRLLIDLNDTPDIAGPLTKAGAVGTTEDEKLDAATCVVSIDYLNKPVEVLKSLREVTKQGGRVHLTISNRCFPTKAVARWLGISEDERLLMVGDYLQFAGWSDIEIVELSNGRLEEQQASGNTLQNFMGMIGMNSRDPLWVVRAVNR
ncbi:hypothetical protein AMS68_001162 [Peltaster fructicola]|uniref:Methyltransferase type 11 domain-containing protein n=1 Tax=Peltaster fructicola TaxID=286661 RepID=A0A6H0XLY8_9PEZI|nr:hypothetical protein AMS68_001162 [Peltaster fructicola]